MKRCLLIINPSSGQRTIQNSLDKLTGQLILQQLVNHIDVFYTQKKDDAYNHVLNVDEKNYDFIIVVGGDGTINEVVSGMVSTNKKIPLCILAAGTVNDFANYLNLPNHKNILEYIMGDCSDDSIDRLNNLMKNKLNLNNNNSIYIHYSTEEETYASDIKPLLEEMNNINLKVRHDKKNYDSHAELTLYFPEYIKNSIRSILGE